MGVNDRPQLSWWQQYKRTFVGMQLAIAAVTVGAYLTLYHRASSAAVFFVILQVGSIAGAHWGSQLKKRFPAGL